jgi:hypothetical protein
MKKNIVLVIALGITGLIGFIYSAIFFITNLAGYYVTHPTDIVGIIILMAVALTSSYFSVEMPQQGQVTVSSGIFYACMLLFGKEIAILISVISVLVVAIINGQKLKEIIFKTGQM